LTRLNDMESINIKNFGPIKDATIEVKEINVFIGPTSSGKSIIAKLIAIFKNKYFFNDTSKKLFLTLCKDFNIHSFINPETEIIYKHRKSEWSFKYKDEKLSQKLSYSNEILDLNFFGGLRKDRLAEFLRSDGILPFPKKVKSPSDIDISYYKLHTSIQELQRDPFSKEFLKSTDSYAKEFYFLGVSHLGISEVTYIPAERIVLSMVAESIFGLLSNDVSIAECIKNFGRDFEKARKEISSLDIRFMDLRYEYKDNQNKLLLGDNKGVSIKLEEASSGMQATVPMLLILEHILHKKKTNKNPFIYPDLVVIEEPELSLYPIMQKALIEKTITVCNTSKSKLIITTHSPYIISAIDNLIAAHNTVSEKPKSKAKVKKLVAEEAWVPFDNVSCYYIDNGTATDILDPETKSIKSYMIDDVSESIGEVFDQLTAIRYN